MESKKLDITWKRVPLGGHYVGSNTQRKEHS